MRNQAFSFKVFVALKINVGAIKWMQKKLNELTPGTNIEVDGIWGKMTTAQLKRYWKRLGWSTAGSYCGKKTCKALYANRKK